MKPNTVSWFEIATDEPEAVQEFYGELFGWEFTPDENARQAGIDYRSITVGGGEQCGGVYATGGRVPNHAIFNVYVDDVEATCARIEKLGGKVVQSNVGSGMGTDYAYILDPSDGLFGIFTMPEA
ncbi:VOC family protein [Rhizohabitans arisaemae]|uniref:VOC family protein n=1 Tax=Rhizohabitans arisaemae TaxID=2720610 RepID=UPI0024B125AE|nr:VOC family protein [Rhizohabitans arisaemae]